MTFIYQVDIEQDISLAVEGDMSTLGEEDFPGDAEVNLTGSATFTQTVADGPRPGTFEVTITGEFTELAATGTVAGENIDEVPAFADLGPIDSTFVVDEQGHIIGSDTGSGDPFGQLMDPGALDPSTMPGLDPGRFLGPELPDDGVGVGDTWETQSELPGFGQDPVVVRSMSTVIRADEIEGAEVVVIDTNISSTRLEIDLGDLMLGMFGALVEGMDEEDAAQYDELLENLRFLMFIDGAMSDATTWVAPGDGVVWRSESVSSASMGIDLNIPDQDTGEVIEGTVDMSLRQNLTYQLVEGPSA